MVVRRPQSLHNCCTVNGLIQAGQDLLDALQSLASGRFRTRLRNGGVLRCDREGEC